MDYELERDFIDYKNTGVNNAFTHFHKSIELVVCISGTLSLHINGEKHLLNDGEAMLIPPYYSHSYFTDNNQVSKVYCFIAPISDYYIGSISQFYNHDLIIKNKKIVKEICDSIDEISPKSPNFYKEGLGKYIIAKFVEAAGRSKVENSSDKKLFLKIVEYINIHHRENITLESISQEFHYSKCYFSSLFNRLFNRSLNDFLNIVRIQDAVEMLDEKPATEIAYELGYANLQSFFYNFKKNVGCTPKEFKKRKELLSK